jgi:integrase
MEKESVYKERLDSYELADYTKKQYLYYYKKLRNVIKDLEVTEEIANAFLKDYPNSVCMAFLNDYSKWKRLALVLEDKIVKRKVQKDKHYISQQEIKILGNWLKEHYGIKYKLMVYLAYNCALRRKETLGLKIEYLKDDFKEWKEGQSLRLTIHKKSAKGGKERTAIVPSNIAKSLKSYIKSNMDIILSTSHPNNIFRVKASRWQTVFKEGVRKGLNKDYTLHELRFSKATKWWREQGFDIVTIQKLLGHADIKTTQRYIDPAQEEALRRLEEIYALEKE